MTDKVLDIEERVSGFLQESLNELYLLRQEETGHLEEIKERARSLVVELKDLAAAIDSVAREHNLAREELMESSRRGGREEKFSYERASELMKTRASMEERYRLLSVRKDELAQEERRLTRFVSRSENMGNRLRMVLNLITAPDDFSITDDPAGAEHMMSAFLMAEREATTLARELHDGPTQIFAAVGLVLEMSKEYLARGDYAAAKAEVERALSHTRDGLNEIRAFLFNLNPTGIENGFEQPMKHLTSQVREMWGCALTYTLDGELGDVSTNVRLGAFKTLHQAVINAARHGATEVKAVIGYTKKTLRVRVSDNGKGFDVEGERQAAKKRGSYGLINMEERVKMLGGKFSISSVILKGSRVSFSIPVLA